MKDLFISVMSALPPGRFQCYVIERRLAQSCHVDCWKPALHIAASGSGICRALPQLSSCALLNVPLLCTWAGVLRAAHNLWVPGQNENVGPLFKEQEKIKMPRELWKHKALMVFSVFFFFFFFSFWLCWIFIACGLSLVAESGGLLSSCSAQASHCRGFSCCKAQALGA